MNVQPAMARDFSVKGQQAILIACAGVNRRVERRTEIDLHL